MLINSLGSLKAGLARYMFHQRFQPDYDTAVQNFEAAANRRLRVLPMETSTNLAVNADGAADLPSDYLLWRTVLWDNPSIPGAVGRQVELDYVHPAYLKSTNIERAGRPKLFTIEGLELIIRPPDVNAVINLHYYGKIPTINGNDNNSNWLLAAHSDAYLYGVLTELFVLGRNAEAAQLYKARRDEVFAEIIQLYALTTGATSPQVREAEYF